MSASGTPFPFLRTPTLNSTNIISYSAFLTPSTPVTPTPGSNRGQKRKDKENQLPTMYIPSKKAKVDLTDGETLYKTSVSLANLNKSHKAALYSSEKRSELKYHAAKVISSWYHHPYGRLERESNLMFSITVPYKDIGPVRPALSSFAAQVTAEKLLEEAEKAIKPDNGLHVTLSTNLKQTIKKIEWTDLGFNHEACCKTTKLAHARRGEGSST